MILTEQQIEVLVHAARYGANTTQCNRDGKTFDDAFGDWINMGDLRSVINIIEYYEYAVRIKPKAQPRPITREELEAEGPFVVFKTSSICSSDVISFDRIDIDNAIHRDYLRTIDNGKTWKPFTVEVES